MHLLSVVRMEVQHQLLHGHTNHWKVRGMSVLVTRCILTQQGSLTVDGINVLRKIDLDLPLLPVHILMWPVSNCGTCAIYS